MNASQSMVPTRCIVRHPTTQTVWFAGCPINISAICSSFIPPLDHSYVSRVFSLQRAPSLDYAEKISTALGMQLQAFYVELRKLRPS